LRPSDGRLAPRSAGAASVLVWNATPWAAIRAANAILKLLEFYEYTHFLYSLSQMPASAGRVRMPHNNRMSSSAALKTHGIWTNTIKHDPYAGEGDEAAPAVSAADQAASMERFNGMMTLARMSGSTAHTVNRGACKKCGSMGHMTHMCRNALSARGGGAAAAAAAGVAAAGAAGADVPSDWSSGDSDSDSGSGSSSSSDEDEEEVAQRAAEKEKKRARKKSRKKAKKEKKRAKKEKKKEKKKAKKAKKKEKKRRSKKTKRASAGDPDESADEERAKKKVKSSE
tara:strand:+ start:503 stop:1354 length:852 start_codon:yes stop_codon:yes gene_type:complete